MSRRPKAVAAVVVADPAAALADVHVLPREGNHWSHVAAVFARLVAQGLMTQDDALAPMCAAAALRFPAMDASGQRMRLAHALADAVVQWRLARDRVRFAVRRALGPLLAERRASGVLMAAARAVNAESGWPLLEAEVLEMVRNEVFWAARRAQKTKVLA